MVTSGKWRIAVNALSDKTKSSIDGMLVTGYAFHANYGKSLGSGVGENCHV